MRRDIAAVAALLLALLAVLVVLALSGVFDGDDPARVGAGVAGGVVASGPDSSTVWSTSAVGVDDGKRDRRSDHERNSPALAVDPTPVGSGGAGAAVPIADTAQAGGAPPAAAGVAQSGAGQRQAAPNAQADAGSVGQVAPAVGGAEVPESPAEQAEEAPAEDNSGSGSSGSGSSGSGSSGSGSSGSGSSGSG